MKRACVLCEYVNIHDNKSTGVIAKINQSQGFLNVDEISLNKRRVACCYIVILH